MIRRQNELCKPITWPEDEFQALFLAYREAYTDWMSIGPPKDQNDWTEEEEDKADALFPAYNEARRNIVRWIANHLDDDEILDTAKR